MADPVVVIQATLAPIFLVNGAAIFLNFTQARLFRVIDRLRALDKEMKEAPEEERPALARERVRSIRRAVILRNAILFGVLVIACTVVTTLLLLWSGTHETAEPGPAPIYAFAGALAAFGAALALVTTDAFLSVAAARAGFRELVPHRS
ncbi:MAG TPA: DUF2721 domain-containing protein [Candidatus Thermoplasmatota archaeon]|nr:DUF2721 domain-containing protein [Candidatus Thermoplasmatota archaeon]